jgi:hypothetical protein
LVGSRTRELFSISFANRVLAKYNRCIKAARGRA